MDNEAEECKITVFLSPTIDLLFKLIFGDAKSVAILIGFLKAVLGLPAEEFESIEIVNPHLLQEHLDDKLGILDLKVKTKKGLTINVEIQVQPRSNFAKRVSFYQAKMIGEQMGKGSDYSGIQKVVSIIIVDYKLFPDEGHYHSRFTMYDPKNGRQFSETQEIHVLELPKLPETEDGTERWGWGKFFKAKSMEELEMTAEMFPATEIKQAVARYAELTQDQKTRMLIEARQIYEIDRREERDFARREGEAIGEARGRLEGEARAMEAAARKALAGGLSPEAISSFTGLDIETIRRL
ncbi:MAG: Rpn family recombination-promoting nuclease/putative transposase [Spirochaetes bacterium]|nr:Rpn family recombination-promoting nuclease/putative transposase [Spirochaetota bacterium]